MPQECERSSELRVVHAYSTKVVDLENGKPYNPPHPTTKQEVFKDDILCFAYPITFASIPTGGCQADSSFSIYVQHTHTYLLPIISYHIIIIKSC